MRASRLLSLLLLLQSRGRMTAQDLARELEVSVRTVYRDVDALGAAGVPVVAERGPTGGYRLLDGYRTRLTGLSADEAESLFLAGAPGPAAALGLGEVLAVAQLKLLAALPAELRERAGRVRERFLLDPATWFREADEPRFLAEIADAVWNRRPLRVRYRRWGGEVDRTLEPLGLVLKGGSWYLVAAADGQPRTYRAARVLALETLPGRFARPDGFDLAAYWREWSDGVHARLHRSEAVVRLSPRALDLLPKLFDPTTTRAALTNAEPADESGWQRLTLPIESVEHALVALLQFGADAEVLSPPELRERLAATAREMVDRYSPTTPTERVVERTC